MICPPGKSMSFHKKETEKNELVARPAEYQTANTRDSLREASNFILRVQETHEYLLPSSAQLKEFE